MSSFIGRFTRKKSEKHTYSSGSLPPAQTAQNHKNNVSMSNASVSYGQYLNAPNPG